MSAAGIIFSNVHDENLSELTRIRSLASVPFGSRYRLIDFTLSNMVNSNINNISVITNTNYNSLMDHIGTGKDWDLARRSGGIKIFPPNVVAYKRGTNSNSGDRTDTRLSLLRPLTDMVAGLSDDYVVLSDCDVICNIDFGAVIDEHIKTGADMTLVVKNVNVDLGSAHRSSFVKADKNGKITDVMVHPNDLSGDADMILNIIVMSRKYLYDALCDAQVHNYTSLTRDIIARHISDKNYRIYRCNSYFACISSLENYFKENMNLIKDRKAYNEIFGVESRPVYTKVRNSAPTYYDTSSVVKNSLIADGCQIEGTVENSILFRGVKIGRGAVVKKSILFQDVFTGENVKLDCVVADKNVVIRDGRALMGCETLPYYIEKGKML